MNRQEMEFAVFCIESIAERLGSDGADVYVKLGCNSTILDEYIVPNYAALHTQDKEYIVEDILAIMRTEGLAP